MGKQIKSSVLLTPLQQDYSYFNFSLPAPAIQLFISVWAKSCKDVYHSPPHVSGTGNILITIITFSR